MATDIKQYIIDERAKGTPDTQIYTAVQKMQATQKTPSERGFWGEVLPTAFSVGGGIIGGITAGPPGAIAGAAGGGALGETIQQKIEKSVGERETFSPGQIAATGAIGAASEFGGQLAFKAGGKAVQIAKPKVINFFKAISGYSDDAVKAALERTPGAIAGVTKGEVALDDIIDKSALALSKLAKESVEESKSALETLSKTTLSDDSLFAKALQSGAAKYSSARKELLNTFGDFTKSISDDLRGLHNIGVDKNGTLSFSRVNQPSRIVSTAEQKAVQESFKLINNVKNNMSLKNVDATLERLIVLQSKTPVGTPTGTETKAIIKQMMDRLMGFVDGAFPKSYGELLKKNLQKRVFIDNAQELLGVTAHPTAKEKATIAKRLLQLYETGNYSSRTFLETAGKELGEDITGTTAGTILKTGGQVAVGPAAMTSARGAMTKLLEYIPRKSLQNFVRTGEITGDLLKNKPLVEGSLRLVLTGMANLAGEKSSR